jgi:hypothetical protein
MKRFVLLATSLGLSVLPLDAARAAAGESSFTPTSFVMPIYSIRLALGYNVNVPLYTCASSANASLPSADAGDAGSADECLVDMADAAALDSLFSQPAAIPPGTYDRIVIGTCASDSAFVARVKGSVQISDTTYYTTSGVPPISTDEADLDYARINYSGCGNEVMLPEPVTIAAGDAITVSAFFTLQNLSWVLGNLSPELGGCAEGISGGFSVCSGLPVLVAYIGTAAPTLESYYITEDPEDTEAAKAAGQVMILSSGGEPFSGFLRRVYSPESQENPSVSYDVPLREITRNSTELSDAGVSLDAGDAPVSDAGAPITYDVYAIGDPFQDTTKYRVRFPRFELGDHTGTLFTANGETQLPYRAVRR